MKKCVILLNAYSKMKEPLNQANRLKDELFKLGVLADIKRNDGFLLGIKDSKITSNLKKYDFCVFLDKDKYLLNMIEKSGLKVFNTPSSIEYCDDKMTTYIRLAGNGVPLVKTLPGLLCYSKKSRVKKEALLQIEKQLDYPIVVKESFGSLGKGVYLAKNREELLSIMRKLKTLPHLFQEFISSSAGVDYRIIVIGKKAVASMKRFSKSDFRSNIALGGSGINETPPNEFIKVAEKCAQVLNLDYCGVDLLIAKDGSPLVCEVNSNAFFDGIERVSNVNVAKLYAEHLVKEVYGEIK